MSLFDLLHRIKLNNITFKKCFTGSVRTALGNAASTLRVTSMFPFIAALLWTLEPIAKRMQREKLNKNDETNENS